MAMKTLSVKNIGMIPKAPGVYRFFHARELLYIGKAADLQSRVKSHFQAPSYRDRLFMDQVTRVAYEETPSDIDALLLEAALIKKYQPKYNVLWKDDKKYFYVEITKEPLPRVFVAHQQTKVPTERIGPFTDGRALTFALRVLRRVFPYYTSGKKHGALACGYCHIDLCPGPNPDVKAYRSAVAKLTAVLKGRRTSVMRALQARMKRESREGNFERAATLRDQWFALEKIAERGVATMPPKARQDEYDAIATELSRLLRAKRRISRVEEFDVSNIQGRHAVGSMVVFVEGRPAKHLYRKFTIRAEAVPNDVAMMKEIVTRRLRHREWGMPDLLVVDGGRGQLSAALAAFKETGYVPSFAVAGLAKGRSEMFVAGHRNPISLNSLAPATRNMLISLKDEAHRFAITFHKNRRSIDTFKGA